MNDRQSYPERIIPDETASGIVAVHLKRYNFAREYLKGLRVLDVACGVGYGSVHLAEDAAEVVGVDLDSETIKYAKTRYNYANNVQFLCEDGARLPFESQSFDAVCSFETIEHVPDANTFLSEVVRVLKPDGSFFVSTPAAQVTTQSPANPFHVQEWSPADFRTFLERYFDTSRFYTQMPRTTKSATTLRKLDVFKLRGFIPLPIRRLVASCIGVHTMSDLILDDVQILEGLHPKAREIVAVCHGGHGGLRENK